MALNWQQWYKHDINAWQGSANVQALSDAGYRAFHHLVQAQFQSEDGMLPVNDRQLAKLSRKADVWNEIREEVMELFVAGPEGRIYNQKQYDIWLDSKERGEKASKKGKSGAEARFGRSTSMPHDNPEDATGKPKLKPENATGVHVTERNGMGRKEKEDLAPDAISPEMISRSVLVEASLSGDKLEYTICDIARQELARGQPPDEVRDKLVAAWKEYDANAAKLSYHCKPETFFGGGKWRNKAAWGWKQGMEPPVSGRKYANVS